jgi:hypothetical protein
MAEIGRAAVNLEANTSDLEAGMKAAAAAVENSTARMNRALATTNRVGERLDKLESGTKGISRAIGDARGAMELLGASGGSLAPIVDKIGGIADGLGTLATLFKGGAASFGGGLSAVIPVLTVIATTATAAYGAYRLLTAASEASKRAAEAQAKATEEAAAAQSRLADALTQAQRVLSSNNEEQATAAEGQRRAAADALERAANEITLARALRERAIAELDASRAAVEGAAGASPTDFSTQTVVNGIIQQQARLRAEADALQASALGALQQAARVRATPSLGELSEGLRTSAGAARQEIDALSAALEKLRAQQDQAAQSLFDSTRTAEERYQAEIDGIERLRGALAARFGEEEAADIARRATEAATASLNRQGSSVASLNKEFTAYGDSINNAFEQAIFQGRKFDDVLKGLAQTLAQQIFRQTVGNQLSSALTGAISGVFGGGGKPGLFSFGSSGTFDASKVVGVGGLKGFAEGGRPPVGRPSVIGERGPEIFVPDVAGTILPNGVAPAMASGGYVDRRTYNIDARNSTLSAAQIAAIIRAASDDAVARVPDRTRRGGGYRAAVQGA